MWCHAYLVSLESGPAELQRTYHETVCLDPTVILFRKRLTRALVISGLLVRAAPPHWVELLWSGAGPPPTETCAAELALLPERSKPLFYAVLDAAARARWRRHEEVREGLRRVLRAALEELL